MLHSESWHVETHSILLYEYALRDCQEQDKCACKLTPHLYVNVTTTCLSL